MGSRVRSDMPQQIFVEHSDKFPRGEKGARLSVYEAAAKARAARLDPQVRAWAIDALIRFGASREDDASMARALLLAERADLLYVPDPVDGEFIVSPECLLGTCGGIRFRGGDCDDLAAGLAAALMSVGIRAALVGQGYPETGHVLVAAYDRRASAWVYLDPTEDLPVSVAPRAIRELWIDALTGKNICEGEGCLGAQAVPAPPASSQVDGDYVGVSGSPSNMVECVQATNPLWWLVVGISSGAVLASVVFVLWKR